VITKLDGTAKGGSVIALRRAVPVPIRFLGTGENVDDLELFDPVRFRAPSGLRLKLQLNSPVKSSKASAQNAPRRCSGSASARWATCCITRRIAISTPRR